MQLELRNPNELRAYEKNARTHSDEQVAEIADSIRKYGFINPIITDGDGVVIAGHARLMAAISLGLTEVPTIAYSHLRGALKQGYILADNRMALSAGWDTELLIEELRSLDEQGFELRHTGFTADEIEIYLKSLPDEEVDGDSCGGVAETAFTRRGDLWLLGKHRLMCGDSVQQNDLDALMGDIKADMLFTDPPYNQDYSSRVDKTRRKAWGGIKNDNLTPDEFEQFIADMYSSAAVSLKENASAYVCINYKMYPLLIDLFKEYFTPKSTIIWNKKSIGLGTYYRTQYEMILFGVYGDKLKTWNGESSESDVWDCSRDTLTDYQHPTQKPVELVERAILNSSNSNDVILDLFGGSGTTLIACEKNNRQCRMMEMDEKYCDVIIRRWENFTGMKATLAATGEPFNG